MRTWIDIAELAHTKNLNGGLVARSAAGLPFLLHEGMSVALVPPVLDAPRNVVVESVQMRNDAEALVFFEEVTTAEVADALVGCHCLARRDEVDLGEFEDMNDLPSWEGWQVFDAREGFVGTVSGIDERPYQPLLVVAREGRADALIPLVEDFLVNVDEEARRIDMKLASGLLDL